MRFEGVHVYRGAVAYSVYVRRTDQADLWLGVKWRGASTTQKNAEGKGERKRNSANDGSLGFVTVLLV